MRHGSLFSGIGGFDLAAEWMGWENIFHCEWNPFGQRVLKYHFPKSISYEDITKTDFSIHRGSIDILSGGFPCQPYSSAGKRLGKADERHLWPQMLRAIKEIQPRWVVGENVLGIVNWNGGLVFDEVQADLENEGYKVQAYILPAVSVNAPHVRQRVFFIAYSYNTRNDISMRNRREWQKNNKGWEGQPFSEYRQDGSYGVATDSELNATRQNIGGYSEEKEDLRRGEESDVFGTFCGDGNAADTDGIGLRRQGDWSGESRFISKNYKRNDWSDFPTVTPICIRDDGFSNRLDRITFPKWRNESIKAAGNAVVPQLILQLFKTIAEYERITNSEKDNGSSD
jgi:DNA (cytosine-5)-methyltransferase 1